MKFESKATTEKGESVFRTYEIIERYTRYDIRYIVNDGYDMHQPLYGNYPIKTPMVVPKEVYICKELDISGNCLGIIEIDCEDFVEFINPQT